MIRVVDNKKLFLNSDEFSMYQKICRSYDRPNFKGEELFKDHFETDNAGIILFVKPPHNKYSSLEVYCFLVSLMVNQHIRIMYEQSQLLVKEASKKIGELMGEVSSLKAEVKSLVEKAQVESSS